MLNDAVPMALGAGAGPAGLYCRLEVCCTMASG